MAQLDGVTMRGRQRLDECSYRNVLSNPGEGARVFGRGSEKNGGRAGHV